MGPGSAGPIRQLEVRVLRALFERLIHSHKPGLRLSEQRPQQPDRPACELFSLDEPGLAAIRGLQLENMMTVGYALDPNRSQPFETLARHICHHRGVKRGGSRGSRGLKNDAKFGADRRVSLDLTDERVPFMPAGQVDQLSPHLLGRNVDDDVSGDRSDLISLAFCMAKTSGGE
jgi:hypothetical protein